MVVFRMRVLPRLFSLQKLFSLSFDVNFEANSADVDALNPFLSLVVVATGTFAQIRAKALHQIHSVLLYLIHPDALS